MRRPKKAMASSLKAAPKRIAVKHNIPKAKKEGEPAGGSPSQ